VAPSGTDDQQRIAELETRNAELAARNAELEALVAKLNERLEELTEKLRQNSGNSHLPPSSDGPGAGARRNRSRKKGKDKRKRGGQKGHRGAHRELAPAEQVDRIIDMFPEVCDGCGAVLPQTPDSEPRRHQLIDLVDFRRYIAEFRRHEVGCCCGHRTRAAYDPQKIPASPFGPRLMVVVATLTGVYHLSREQTKQLLHEVLGIEISVGAISAIEARVSAALVSAVNEVQRAVQQASVKYTDGTSWLQAGLTMSLWTIATAAVTLYKVLKNGRRETIRPLFGALFGILVSDRATVFNFWAMALRQICHAHLLRKFISFSERDGPAGVIGAELVSCSMLMFEYWDAFKNGTLNREELEIWMRPLQSQFEATLERAVAANIKRLSGSCADILAHKDALWTFVTHEDVDPTNNDAERALRPFVLWRKKSYGAQSERGHRFAERIMTVVHTARKQGKSVVDFLVACVTAVRDSTTPPSLLAATAA
jgi:transposase